MKNLLASAGNKEDLEKLINKFYYSTNYIITEENEIYNTKLNKIAEGTKIIVKKGRWRFEMIEE